MEIILFVQVCLPCVFDSSSSTAMSAVSHICMHGLKTINKIMTLPFVLIVPPASENGKGNVLNK